MDADLLAQVAKSLRKSGDITLARECQRRATELAPDDPTMWYSLGDLAQREGDLRAALNAYQRCLALKKYDPKVSHLIAALSDGPKPPRMSDEGLLETFEDFAPSFDERMRELEYRAPQLLAQAVWDVIGPPTANLLVLDLGCGTGLVGEQFRQWASVLHGVDISPGMVELMQRRTLYDHVFIAEIMSWLPEVNDTYDLVVACDVLIYMGDLTGLTRGVSRLLTPHGHFGFTLERCDDDYTLTGSGRYAHSAQHVREVALETGFEIRALKEGVLRLEQGEPVRGLVVVLQKAVPETAS